MYEEDGDIQRATFFEHSDRTHELTLGCKRRRAIILTMFRLKNEFLTINELSKRSEVKYTTVKDNITLFVKANLVKKDEKAVHGDRKDSIYSLTPGGRCVALAVSYEGADPQNGDYKNTLLELFQPTPQTDSITYFVDRMFLIILDKGKMDYILKTIHQTMICIEKENSGSVDWKKSIFSLVDTTDEEDIMLKEAILSAFWSLQEIDRKLVGFHFKTELLSYLFQISIGQNDRKLQDALLKSELDTGLFIPFVCPDCKYGNLALHLRIEELLVAVCTKKSLCPRCNRKEKLGVTFRPDLLDDVQVASPGN